MVGMLMPSPRNTMTFLARWPWMLAWAETLAACAAPLRNHHWGVSPSGRLICGTSIAAAVCCWAGAMGWLAQAVISALRESVSARCASLDEWVMGDLSSVGRVRQ